jgi:hypothetical protein
MSLTFLHICVLVVAPDPSLDPLRNPSSNTTVRGEV